LQLVSVRRQAGGLRYFKSDFLDALLHDEAGAFADFFHSFLLQACLIDMETIPKIRTSILMCFGFHAMIS